MFTTKTRGLSAALAQILVSAVLFLSIAALTACKTTPPTDTPPVVADCDSKCYEPCVDEQGDTGIRWSVPDYTDPKAWDELGNWVVPSLEDKLRACEVNRKACTKCLDSLQKHGVIQ